LNVSSKGEKMRIFWRVAVALVLVIALVGIGAYAYHMGLAQGLVQKLPVTSGQTVPAPYWQYGHPFFGFGFGPFACLIPLVLLFLFFGSMRALFWHGPMGMHSMHRRHWGWRDDNGKDVPPFFEEWHRRAHAKPDEDQPAGK
jgi:hypothetical protein